MNKEKTVQITMEIPISVFFEILEYIRPFLKKTDYWEKHIKEKK